MTRASGLICQNCPHHCRLEEGQLGLCRGRIATNGQIVDFEPDRISSVALDPIEKKPLHHFHPGSQILSVGAYGCNMRCPFCQNCEISMPAAELPERSGVPYRASVGQLIELAHEMKPRGNIGLALTYNEPLIRIGRVVELFSAAQAEDLKTVLVTNGCFDEEVIRAAVRVTDAWNIDLKAFDAAAYQHLGGSLSHVRRAIELVAAACHVEVTMLIIPGFNDAEADMAAAARWLAQINPKLVLHLSRFFPRHRWQGRQITPIPLLQRLQQIAKEHLQTVLLGNV